MGRDKNQEKNHEDAMGDLLRKADALLVKTNQGLEEANGLLQATEGRRFEEESHLQEIIDIRLIAADDFESAANAFEQSNHTKTAEALRMYSNVIHWDNCGLILWNGADLAWKQNQITISECERVWASVTEEEAPSPTVERTFSLVMQLLKLGDEREKSDKLLGIKDSPSQHSEVDSNSDQASYHLDIGTNESCSTNKKAETSSSRDLVSLKSLEKSMDQTQQESKTKKEHQEKAKNQNHSHCCILF